jgi:hypothetical protein
MAWKIKIEGENNICCDPPRLNLLPASLTGAAL